VLAFVVDKLCIRGKIGVYGRSLGGMAAAHLAATYPDIIKVLIMDRTFSDIDDAASRMIMGGPSLWIFKTFSCLWKSFNDENFCST
jgi:pimeloyl-ACP methyl ester carboxylesterase